MSARATPRSEFRIVDDRGASSSRANASPPSAGSDAPAATHSATQLSACAASHVAPDVYVPDRSGGWNTPGQARCVIGDTSPSVSHTSAAATPKSRVVAPYG